MFAEGLDARWTWVIPHTFLAGERFNSLWHGVSIVLLLLRQDRVCARDMYHVHDPSCFPFNKHRNIET